MYFETMPTSACVLSTTDLGEITSLLAKVMCLCCNYRCVCTYLCIIIIFNAELKKFLDVLGQRYETRLKRDGVQIEKKIDFKSFLQRSTFGSAAIDIEPGRSAPGYYVMSL